MGVWIWVLGWAAVLASPSAPDFGTEARLERDDGAIAIHFTRSDRARAEATLTLIDRLRSHVERRLGLPVPLPLEVVLAPTRRHFDRAVRTLTHGATPPTWSQAVAIPAASTIVIRARTLRATGGDRLEQVLAHELAHMSLWRTGDRLPQWAEEGLAMWVANERPSPHAFNTLARMAKLDTLPSLRELEHDFPEHTAQAQLAYALSAAFIDWVAKTYGAEKLGRMLALLDRGLAFEAAFERGCGAPLRGSEIVFRRWLAARYRLWRDVFTTEGLLALGALLTVLAFVRYRLRRRRWLRAMAAEEEAASTSPAPDRDTR